MVTKDLQTLNLKFDQVMFNSLVFTWEINFEVPFSIFSVLVSQINVLESYSFKFIDNDCFLILANLDIVLFSKFLFCSKDRLTQHK